jgi:hypothetical protein
MSGYCLANAGVMREAGIGGKFAFSLFAGESMLFGTYCRCCCGRRLCEYHATMAKNESILSVSF